MLALISGRGGLPAEVARVQPVAPMICALQGFEPDDVNIDLSFRLEHLGTLIQQITSRGVTEVCFCGAIERPPFDPAALDEATLPLVPTMMAAMGAGDDGALRAAIALFEKQGFRIRAAHELAPDLLAKEAVFGSDRLDEAMHSDIARADAVLKALAPLDVGQGCVVGAGQVWGIETTGGTNHMLSTLPPQAAKARAVFVKAPKQGQDMRADVPTIGPKTVDAVIRAGLAGIVVEAGGVIVLNSDEVERLIEASGLIFWSRARTP